MTRSRLRTGSHFTAAEIKPLGVERATVTNKLLLQQKIGLAACMRARACVRYPLVRSRVCSLWSYLARLAGQPAAAAASPTRKTRRRQDKTRGDCGDAAVSVLAGFWLYTRSAYVRDRPTDRVESGNNGALYSHLTLPPLRPAGRPDGDAKCLAHVACN